MSAHEPAITPDQTPPAKTWMNRRDWGFAVIVASVFLALVLAGLYLSYEANPWADVGIPPLPSGPAGSGGKPCDVQLWVNDDQWISCPYDENPTVNDAMTLLMDTYPELSKPSARLRAVSLSRWNLFDARRIGPRFAELIDPLLHNDYWSVPSSMIDWFGNGPADRDCFHVACTDEKRLPTMKVEPGDRINFAKE